MAMKTKRHGKGIFTLAAATLLALGFAACGHAANLALDVRAENRRVLVPGPGDGTIQIQVVAPDLPPVRKERMPLNLALVIDRSGSMSEAAKLEYVKSAAHQLVDLMAPDDILSIVAYDHEVQVPWPSRRVGRDRGALHRLIGGLYPGGATCLSGGLEAGFRQAKGAQRRGYLSRVLLLSDGLANRGVVDRGELRGRAAGMSEEGVSVSTFGVGNDFDEELMMMLAGGGGGNYRYLGDPERIVAALEGEFRAVSGTAAVDVEIVIRLRRDCRFGSVLGREWRREGDGYVIRLGDLSAGERRTLFANVNVATDRTGMREVGDVAIRYRDPATSRTVTGAARPVSLELVRDERSWREGFDRSVQEKKAVAQSSVLVQDAARLADQGRKAEAKATLGRAAEALAAAPPSPAVAAEMKAAASYGRTLDEIGDLGSAAGKAAQKSIKYKSYETLQQR
jgi:Ca-activated chloride channel family protein